MRRTNVVFRVVLLCSVMAVMAVPAFAQGDPFASATTFMDQFMTFLQGLAVVAATCGVLGLAIIQFGTPFPLIGDWKKENPKMVREVVTGIFFMLFITLGGLAAMGIS